jgi:hypothetical protein
LAASGIVVCAAANAAVESGLKVGDRAPAFYVTDVTGPNKGKELCYRCKYGDAPVVTMFTRELSEPIVATIVELDKKLAKNEKLKGFVVYLTDDAEGAKAELEKIAKDKNIKNVPLTIMESKGPANYKISPDAGVTVLMWNKSEVRVNHAFEPGSFCGGCSKEVIADVAKILPEGEAAKAN